jgi:hypothetical protein
MTRQSSEPAPGPGEFTAASPLPDDSLTSHAVILGPVEPLDRLRSAGKRVTDPLETLSQRVAERVVDLVVQALDVNALMRRVDLNAVLDQVDINKLLGRLDVSALMDQVDLNELLARVDVSALVDRVDVNEILARVDVERLLDRVDVNDVVDRLDLDQIIEDTNLGAVIAKSSAGVMDEALDAARSGAVGLDRFIDRWIGRALWRKHPRPVAPQALLNGAVTNGEVSS